MKKPYLILALLLGLASTSHAQIAELPNAVPVGPEGITITACTPSCTLQIGASTAWSAAITNPPLPLLVNYAEGSTNYAELLSLGGPDPDPDVSKQVVAIEGSAAYTVGYIDLTGTAQTLAVPAVAPAVVALPAACAAPTAENANPVLPATVTICPQLANMTDVAPDGSTVVIQSTAEPLIAQYCADAATCAPPFMWAQDPITVSPATPMLGGNPAPNSASRTLYIQAGARPTSFTITNASGAVQPSVIIPSLPGS